MKKTDNILVVLPHPDDEAFGLAGSLAMHASQGAHITYACLTLGEMGRNMGFPPIASRVTLPQIRKAELEASCRAIGIQDLRLLGFHDKTIEFEDEAVLDGKIGGLIDELKPSIIYTFYPGYSVHPDHNACGAAVVRAAGRLPERDRPAVLCLAFSRDHEKYIGKPDVVRDVSKYLNQKKASLAAHRTQFRFTFTDAEFRERFGVERFWTYPFR